MNGEEVVALVKRRMARFGSSTSLDADVVIELNQAQKRLELNPFLPWFLLSERSTISTVEAEARIIVPTDMIREYEEGTLWVLDAQGGEHELTKNLWDELKNDSRFDGTGRPKRYATVGLYFRLRPIPDAIYTLRMIYYKAQSVIVQDGTTNQWLTWGTDLLVAEAGFILATSYTQNDKSAKMFRDMIPAEMTRLMIADEARKHANIEYVGED